MSFFEERARMLERSTETDKLSYKKNQHGSDAGQRYVDGCVALLLLRCLRRGLRFAISPHDVTGGSFNDLLVCWKDERSPSVSALFAKLKNKTSDIQKTIERSNLLGLEEARFKDFPLKKYHETYKKLSETLDGDSYVLLVFTNIDVDEDAQHMFLRCDPESVPGLQLLGTGGCCYKLNADDEDVRVAVQGDNQFTEHFYFLCNQSDYKTIPSDIRTELKLLLAADGQSCATLCRDLCDSIREWINTKSLCLTSNWSEWLNIGRTYIRREVTCCRSVVTRIKYSHVQTLGAHIDGHNPAWIRPPVREAAPLTATKIHQIIRAEDHIMVSMTRFTEMERKIKCCWGQFCRWLVLVDDVESSYEILLQMEKQVGPNRRLVIVSEKRDDSYQDTCQSSDIHGDSWEQFMDVTIKLNSEQHSCRLRAFCDTEALKAMLDGNPEALVALTQLSGPLRMGQGLDLPPKDYIPRQLAFRMRIRREFFSSLGDKEMCIVDEESYKLLMHKSILKNTVRFEELEKCLSASDAVLPRFVVINNIDLSVVQSICSKYPDVIKYVISYVDDEWEILFLHRGREKILPYVEEQSRSLLQIVSGMTNQFIVEGKPGVGKSTLLLDMAQQLKGQHNSWWILRVNLIQYSEIFDSCDSGVQAGKTILIGAVHNEKSLGTLERMLLRYCLLEHPRIICMVDGFDEICPDYAEKCLQALQELAPRRGKLVVTTRPSATHHLEDALGVLAHSLPPFDEDQVRNFHGWSRSETGVTDVVRDLLKIPLFSRMYADSLKSEIEVTDVVSLYEAFFERKFRRLFEETWGENLNLPGKMTKVEMERREHEKQLGFLAVSQLLPKLQVPPPPQSYIIGDDLVRAGVIYKFVNDKAIFIHRTYAEHFLAKLCFSDLPGDVCANVYRDAVFDSSLEFFVESFDRMASRGRPLLTAVLNSDESEVRALLEKGEDPAVKDVKGRNSLHLATAYSRGETLLWLLWERLNMHGMWASTELTQDGVVVPEVGEAVRAAGSERVASDSGLVEDSGAARALGVEEAAGVVGPPQSVEVLLSVPAALVEEDGLLRWTPVRYAAERRRWWAVATLMDMGAQLHHLGDFRRHLLSPEWVWNVLEKEGYARMCAHILRKCNSGTSPQVLQRRLEDKRESRTEVGVTLACAEMTEEMCEKILKEALHREHIEISSLLTRKMIDMIKKSESDGSPAMGLHLAPSSESSQTDEHRHVPLQEEYSSTSQQLVTGSDGAVAHSENLQKMLHKAIARGNIKRIMQLIALGADVNKWNSTGFSALHSAVTADSVESIECLLSAGADVNMKNGSGMSPLMLAATTGKAQCVKLLLHAGADPLMEDSDHMTPLHSAAFNRSAECVRLLARAVRNLEVSDQDTPRVLHYVAQFGDDESLQHLTLVGAYDSAMGVYLKTPLHLAAGRGHAECVRQLILAKANVRGKNVDGSTALHYAAHFGHAECVRHILEAVGGVRHEDGSGSTPLNCAVGGGGPFSFCPLVDDWNNQGQTPLLLACMSRNTECVKLLLQYSSGSVKTQNDYSFTPLHFAAAMGSTDIVRLLLEARADIEQRSRFGFTALHSAAVNSVGQCVNLLLEHELLVRSRGALIKMPGSYGSEGGNEKDIEANDRVQNPEGLPPLCCAARSGSADNIKCLLREGVSVGERDTAGNTALHYAASSGSAEAVGLLMEAAADLDVENNDGHTPLFCAVQSGSELCVAMLLRGGPELQMTDRLGNTLLHCAAAAGSVEVVQLLIKEGADVYATTAVGDTALHLAVLSGNFECVEALLEAKAELHVHNLCGLTPLHNAVKSKNHPIIGLLSNAGADAHAQDKNHFTPLHYIVLYDKKNCKRVLELLDPTTTNLEVVQPAELTPLHLAAMIGSACCVRQLLRRGARVGTLDYKGRSALHHAASNGNTECLRILLYAGADVHLKDKQGLTALRWAWNRGHDACIKYLREACESLSKLHNTGIGEHCDCFG